MLTRLRTIDRFCACLDGCKSGLVVSPSVYAEDRKRYGHRQPEWAETPEEAKHAEDDESNRINPSRPQNLHKFIMDDLYNRGKTEGSKHITRYHKHVVMAQTRDRDEHLTARYLRAKHNAKILKDRGNNEKYCELQAIKEHVRTVRDMYRKENKLYSGKVIC